MIDYKSMLSDLGHIYMIVNEQGNIIEHNGLDSLYPRSRIDEIKSIFQINPSLSFLDWSELTKQLDTDHSMTESSHYLDKDQKIQPCDLVLVKQDGVLFYILIPPKIDVQQNPQISISESTWQFDTDCPNSVLYIDEEGVIFFENEVFVDLYGSSRIGENINSIYLESELGQLPAGFSFDDHHPFQYVVRMIIRTKPKMRTGYNRCSKHIANNKVFYRLEFVPIEDMHLVDQPLDSALSEIDKLRQNVEEKNSLLSQYTTPDFTFDEIITCSEKYKKTLVSVAQVADTNTTVLITGQTGTGKELLSNAIYRLSDRSDQPLVKINCASIPSELMESTLFGHEKGAFTDAKSTQIGKFELANNGTIFLDEIGELPINMQAKLLRVLQEGEIERIGNPKSIKVDVRVIAATNRNLSKAVEDGIFRDDLYFRLNVFPIYSLPLKDRREDIPLLVDHFIKKYAILTGKTSVTGIGNTDLQMLKNYDFPGNIRELENMIHRGVILATNEYVKLGFLLNDEQNQTKASLIIKPLDQSIRDHIIAALKITDGKISGKKSASDLLKINAKTLSSKIKKYNIKNSDYKSNGK